MKRWSLLIYASVLMSLTAGAVPVKPGLWRTLTLADGTMVRAEARGSEYGSWWQDADGQCYVLLQAPSASSEQVDCYVKIDRKTLSENVRKNRAAHRRQSRRVIDASTTSGLGNLGWNSGGAMPSNGEWDIPVLMVEFSDAKFKPQHDQALIQDYLTKEGFKYQYNSNSRGSVRDYFVAQSQGKFKPNFKLLGKVTVNRPYAYYGKNGANNKDEHCDSLPCDAMRAAKEQLQADFTKFSKPAPDKQHEAGIPLICMIYAGEAESNKSDENPDLIWPHEYDLGDKGIDIVELGVHLNSYFVGNELVMVQQEEGPDLERLAGIGVFCHELGHALGLPDWYCTDDEEENKYPKDDAFGNWSIMDNGCYLGDAWAPVGYTAYERNYMGWMALGTYDEKDSYTLTAPYAAKELCAFYIPKSDKEDETEYFIVETRCPSTWYPDTLGTGLLITRYAYNQDAWLEDGPNNDKTNKRGQVITAKVRKIDNDAKPSDLFGNGVNTISGLKYHSGVAATFTISNIEKNDDGSVTFNFDPGTTAIETTRSKGEESDGAVYDLSGRIVANGKSSQLPRGLYILNGKKVVK